MSYQGVPYAAQPRDPGSAATAITASVLSFLGVIAHGLLPAAGLVLGGVLAAKLGSSTDDYLPNWFVPWTVVSGVLQITLAVLLLVGGIQLLRHRSSGRVVTAVACVMIIGLAVVEIAITLRIQDHIGFGLADDIVSLVFPAITLTLVLVPSTKRWCQPRY